MRRTCRGPGGGLAGTAQTAEGQDSVAVCPEASMGFTLVAPKKAREEGLVAWVHWPLVVSPLVITLARVWLSVGAAIAEHQ